MFCYGPGSVSSELTSRKVLSIVVLDEKSDANHEAGWKSGTTFLHRDNFPHY